MFTGESEIQWIEVCKECGSPLPHFIATETKDGVDAGDMFCSDHIPLGVIGYIRGVGEGIKQEDGTFFARRD